MLIDTYRAPALLTSARSVYVATYVDHCTSHRQTNGLNEKVALTCAAS